jgi:stage V sporulation protein S
MEYVKGYYILKVSSQTDPSKTAGSIAKMVANGMPVALRAIGAGAVNQAAKAIAIARGFLSPIGIEIMCAPAFADVIVNEAHKTAMVFAVEPVYKRGTLEAVKASSTEFGGTVDRAHHR